MKAIDEFPGARPLSPCQVNGISLLQDKDGHVGSIPRPLSSTAQNLAPGLVQVPWSDVGHCNLEADISGAADAPVAKSALPHVGNIFIFSP